MVKKKRRNLNPPPEWGEAKKLAEGIYQLQLSDSRFCYGFVLPDGTHSIFSSTYPVSLRDLRLHYRAEMKARKMRREMEEGIFELEKFERSQQRRWEMIKRLGLALEREEDAISTDD